MIGEGIGNEMASDGGRVILRRGGGLVLGCTFLFFFQKKYWEFGVRDWTEREVRRQVG